MIIGRVQGRVMCLRGAVLSASDHPNEGTSALRMSSVPSFSLALKAFRPVVPFVPAFGG